MSGMKPIRWTGRELISAANLTQLWFKWAKWKLNQQKMLSLQVESELKQVALLVDNYSKNNTNSIAINLTSPSSGLDIYLLRFAIP